LRTEPIVLNGMAPGQIDVTLDWSRLAARTAAYRIEAVSPNRAAGDEDVVHPHVRDDALCAGEAWSALAAALTTGQPLGFFVRHVRRLRRRRGRRRLPLRAVRERAARRLRRPPPGVRGHDVRRLFAAVQQLPTQPLSPLSIPPSQRLSFGKLHVHDGT